MKNITLVLVALLLFGGVSFAAEPKALTKSPKEHMITGIIEAIKLQPSSANTRSELSVKKSDGNVAKFVLANPTVTDANGKILALDQLKSGEKVKVEFFKSKDGLREIRSITLN